ncbi:unnamed protein product, partial [Angiostrongylus costaricensis]|uniref:Kinesin motor domain-containing protein n=1 Tax=Angiostrongylus costaricensis TaxID=334426 RepID=A0A0R3PT24_ANGCS
GKGKGSHVFEFQRVFGPNVSQERVFNDAQELVVVCRTELLQCAHFQSCVHGYDVSILAYGQTGNGKAHKMRGRFIVDMIDGKFEFKASFVEVYNEEVYDLLAKRSKPELKMGAGITTVNGLRYCDINDKGDVENILLIADRTRSTATTKCNEQSSRSSERVKEFGAEGDRFKEVIFINSALSNLQNCIRSQLNKNQYIPYRNSKLTMLLRDSLGAGNSKTMVIVALNPALAQVPETKRSLEFAQEVRCSLDYY